MKKFNWNISKTGMKKTACAAVAAVLCLTVVFSMGVKVGAAGNEPGSIGDPLVTKSYLDSRLGNASGVMTKVTIAKGGVLTASEGAMIILFSGNGTVSGSGTGLVDVTAGEIASSGISLAKYHNYLFPDAATTVTASSNMVVFVTGSYNVTQ
ncbi:MAG: hypothetical protein ACI4AQ_02720 [Lachnospiraceae bacterium]